MKSIQHKTTTFLRREEGLLQSARKRFEDRGTKTKLRILSFGCSIGDELASLMLVFPDADIVGCDVNAAALDAAQRSVGHFATIVRSDEAVLRALGPFDLIVACSVLCLNPKPNDFLAKFPFSRFEDALGLFDGLLEPGGLIAMINASYRFADTVFAPGYDVVRSDFIWSNGFVDVMDRHGASVLVQATAPGSPFYCKGEAYAAVHDEELADALFEKRIGHDAAVHHVRIAEPPSDRRCTSYFERVNVDGLAIVPEDALLITTRFEFGHDPATGANLLAAQVRWPSVHGGMHHRPWCLLSGGLRPLQRASPR